MFGRKNVKKEEPRRKGGGGALMAQMGMVDDMSQMDSMIYGNVDDDEELERELLALQGEDPPEPAPKPKKGAVHAAELDMMVAASMKDVDDDLNDEDDDDDVDIEDPDLLAELNNLTADDEPPRKMPTPNSAAPAQSGQSMVSLLEDRLSMYRTALDSAKASGESSKVRRIDRGVKTLEDLVKKAKSGRTVNEDDIPPPVAVSSTPASTPSDSSSTEQSPKHLPFEPTTQGAAAGSSTHKLTSDTDLPSRGPPPLSAEDAEKHKMLIGRREEYKVAALKAKRSGDLTTATKYFRIAKQFDAVLAAIEDGKPVDLSQMPPPPSSLKQERESVQGATVASAEDEDLPETSIEDKKKLYKAPTEVTNVDEALQQRLEKYKSTADAAKEAGESGKARRMGRIVKQYEDAIKAKKAGKSINYEELPTPPGFPPIPVEGGAASSAARSPATQGQVQAGPVASQRSPAAPAHSASVRKSVSRAEHQLKFLQERQLQYKTVALKAKKVNNLEAAKKYMKIALGFNQMIAALEEGRPVDMSEIPGPPPGFDKIEAIVKDDSGSDTPTGDRNETYKKLEEDLIKQIKMAAGNADHFTKLGNVSSATQFSAMEKNARKDLDSLKNCYKYGDPVPRFHYETKQFSIVQSCTDLASDELELVIVRGLNYNLPSDYSAKDLDTYVTFELPYPKDETQKGYTETAKSSISPEYNQSFKLKINRKSTVFLRFIKSKSMKLDVYYKRGFFKGDKLLGSVTVKLQALENKCTVHDSYDLMDGRKAVGGKLEVKLRAREPFVSKQVDQVKEKWLVIDHFNRSLPAQQQEQVPVERRVVQGNVKSKMCSVQ